MNLISDVIYGDYKNEQRLDLYLPDDTVLAVFLYFHGGGLESGDKRDAEIFAPYLTERGIAVVSANYRMYPKYKYPEFICDAAQAVAWTHGYMADRLKCKNLYIGGSSAGGYLSMMLCFDKRYLSAVGLDNSIVSGYFHDAGQPTTHFNVLRERGIDSRRIIVDEAAPLYHIGAEDKYPPMRFIVSSNDLHSRYEQTMLTLSALSHFGHSQNDYVLMNGAHCEYVGKLDENNQSVFAPMIYDFIKSIQSKKD